MASTKNFHRSYRWDVGELLREGANELTVTFTSPVRESDRMERWPAATTRTPSITRSTRFASRATPSAGIGGIDVANAGIWREIGIDSWSDAFGFRASVGWMLPLMVPAC